MPRKTTAASRGSHPGRRCGGQVKIVAAVTEPGSIVRIWKGSACRRGHRRSQRTGPIRSESSTSTTQPRLPEASPTCVVRRVWKSWKGLFAQK